MIYRGEQPLCQLLKEEGSEPERQKDFLILFVSFVSLWFSVVDFRAPGCEILR